jgi:hypothetical protein
MTNETCRCATETTKAREERTAQGCPCGAACACERCACARCVCGERCACAGCACA